MVAGLGPKADGGTELVRLTTLTMNEGGTHVVFRTKWNGGGGYCLGLAYLK
jgi:hypothetical protein